MFTRTPLIGFHLTDAVRAGRIQLKPGLSEFTVDGVRFQTDLNNPSRP